MRKSVAELLIIADSFLEANAVEKALKIYLYIIRLLPHLFYVRLKIAKSLALAGDISHATEIHQAVATYYMNSGFPLMAVVALSDLEELDLKVYADTVQRFADLYHHESDLIGHHPPAAPVFTAATRSPDEVMSLSGKLLKKMAYDEAVSLRGIKGFPKELPAAPFLSAFDRDTFIRVVNGTKVLSLKKGDYIIQEGDVGDSLFIIAQGKARVLKTDAAGAEKELAVLDRGAIIGEIALITGAPRTASVQMSANSLLLEIPNRLIRKLQQENMGITHLLSGYSSRRILENVLKTSLFFQNLTNIQKTQLLRTFEARRFKPKEILIRQGTEGAGIYVILTGRVEVSAGVHGEKKGLAQLKEGDIVGEIALIEDIKTTADVVALTETHALFLAREKFNKVLQTYPSIKQVLTDLSNLRITRTRQLFPSEFTESMHDEQSVTVDADLIEEEWVEIEELDLEELQLEELPELDAYNISHTDDEDAFQMRSTQERDKEKLSPPPLPTRLKPPPPPKKGKK